MPKRKPTPKPERVYIGGYVTKDVRAMLVRQADKAGMSTNRFGFAAALIEEALNKKTGGK